jgi:hypothetical protein
MSRSPFSSGSRWKLTEPSGRAASKNSLETSGFSRQRYNVQRLIAAHGADAKLTELLVTLANCGLAPWRRRAARPF